MKKFFVLLTVAGMLYSTSCSPDAEGINETPPPQEEPGEPGKDPSEPPTSEAAKRLETLCEQLNGDLATLYTLVAADELPDCVVNVAPIAPAGETIGYGVSFKQHGAVTLYLAPDATAQKFVPQFGVYEADGIRCWAMNGQPLPSATGAPVPVVNDEGTVPQLKAEKGYWHISVDGGKNWWPAGQAPDGTTELAAMPFVSQVTEEAEAWSIVLADGETAFSVPKEGTLHIAVDAEEPLKFQPHEIHTVEYTVTGGSSKTVVTAELEEPDGSYTMQVIPTDAASGSVAITAQVLYDKNIFVTATDGARTATATVAVTLQSGVNGTTVTVKTAGTLASLLKNFDKNAITELTVIGNLNVSDISTLNNLPNLAVLDMEHVNLEKLENNAFYNNKSLTSVKLPLTLKTIGNAAFQYCSSLTSITIPNSVTTIGERAFSGCNRLTGVYITDMAKWCAIKFGVYAANPLDYAQNLYLNGELVTELVIPDSVTEIVDYAFNGCSSLTSVTIPDGVTTIGSRAFQNCSSLASITIPDGVTSIEDFAFDGCRSLASIYCKAQTPPTIGFAAFNGVPTTTILLYVPIGSADAYRAADDWIRFTNINEMEF
ncbi:MAG: leucine-rich repeat protein [Alistipes sp.]|nr:leucine-rich repeat protein [Alistipes sp.]